MSRQSVEDVWMQLKSKALPKNPVKKQGVKLKPTSSPQAQEGGRRRVEERDNKAGGSLIEGESNTKGGLEGGLIKNRQRCEDDLRTYMAGIQRHINCLSDPDRSTRREAILVLSKILLVGTESMPAASQEILEAVFRTSMLQSTVALLSDPTEKCREAAVQLLGSVLRKASDPSPLCAAIFPAVATRMGNLPVQENTEELRLMLAQLVEGPLVECAGSLLVGYLDELALHLCRAMEDPYHEVKKCGAAAIVRSCNALPPGAFGAKSRDLVKSVVGALGHQHSRVRIASLKALDALVLSGVAAGVLEEIIAPGLGNIVIDQSKAVRESCFEFLAQWMGGCRDSSKMDAQSLRIDPLHTAVHMMPLLLMGLTDEAPGIAQEGLGLIEAVGQAFCESLELLGSDEQAESSAMDTTEDGEASGRNLLDSQSFVDILGPPFKRPPSSQAQRTIVHLLPQMAPKILQSLQSWSHTERMNASRVLQSVACFAQGGCVPHLEQLLPAICGAVTDEDTQITARIINTVHVLGASVQVPEWLHLALDFLLSPRNSPAQKASALVVVSGLLHSGSTCNGHLEETVVQLLVDGLRKEEIRCCDHAGVRMQLTAVVANLINLAGSTCQVVSLALYHLLLQLIGTGVGKLAEDTLVDLANSCGHETPQQLADEHGTRILELCLKDCADWIETSPNYQVFGALLRWSSQACLSTMMESIASTVHGITSDHERDPALRLSCLRLLDDLLEDALLSVAFGGGSARQTLERMMLPAVVWRAGKTAAAVRFAAVTAMATFFRRDLIGSEGLVAVLEAGEVLPLVFQILEEDHYADTRISGCFIATRIILIAGGNLRNEERRLLYPELLRRLDDSNNQVRIAVCASLKALVETMPADYCDTNTGYLLSPMLIHMDDSQKDIKEAVCDVLLSLASKKPNVVAKEVSKIQERFQCREYCSRVLAACKEYNGMDENEAGNHQDRLTSDSMVVSGEP